MTLVDAKNVMSHLREVKPDDAVNEAVQQVAVGVGENEGVEREREREREGEGGKSNLTML